MTFPCTRCGACCRRVGQSPMTKHLAGADGRCVHLTTDNACAIYDSRPDICRVDLMLDRMGFDPIDGYRATAELCNQWMRDDGMTNFVTLTINETGRP